MSKRKSGFTLVEILIVVIILGILAAIVIPQFTNASEDARRSSLASQLQSLRSQIELYKLQHRDTWPTSDGTLTGTWDWSKMIVKTNDDGTTTGTPQLGPYLPVEPRNPVTDSTAIIAGAPPVAAAGGWMVDTSLGKITAVFRNKDGTYVEFAE